QTPAPPAKEPPRTDSKREPIVISPLVETTTSEAVLIEVYATDLKGKTIKDLQSSDLVLKIDSKSPPASISSLEYIEPKTGPGETGCSPGAEGGPAGPEAGAPPEAAPDAAVARGQGD